MRYIRVTEPPAVTSRENPFAPLVKRGLRDDAFEVKDEIDPQVWQWLFRPGSDVLGFAIAERPVFLGDFYQIDDDIFPAQLHGFVQAVGNGFVVALLHFDGAARVHGEWYKDA